MKKIFAVALILMMGSVCVNAQKWNRANNEQGFLLYGILHPKELQQTEKSAGIAFVQKARQYCIFYLSKKPEAEGLFTELEAYLAAGGDVNGQDLLGNTALHIAAQFNNFKLAELLFDYEIEAKVKNKSGRTPLHIARKQGFRDFAIALVNYDPKLPEIMYVAPK